MPVLAQMGPSRGHPLMPTASAPGELSAAARKYGVLPMPSLEWNAQVERETARLYERVKNVVPSIEWPFFAPYVRAINDLKKTRGAVILAHNYQTPEIYNCVADYVGDSLQLAIEATKTKAPVILQAGVHFMAETSKILNPDKTVLIPDVRAGCSLAESITGEDVRLLRDKFPGVPIVAYVNTSADVKAEVDICCTSANAVQVVESLNADKVIFLPDQYLANYRAAAPSLQIIAHPECPPDVLEAADYTGSTKGMIDWVRANKPKRVVMVTECSMADNVKAELPDVEFVKPCNLCPHMKRITLPKILDSLVYMKEEVVIDPLIAAKARRSVERMIQLKN